MLVNFKSNISKAFSLVEISIVIIVIGILVAGIASGLDLYDEYRIAIARQETQNSRIYRIPGLVSWYEATSLKSFFEAESKENSKISLWRDINHTAANRYDLIQADNDRRPIYTNKGINGLPSLKFNGTNTYLYSNGFISDHNTQTFSFFAVTENDINSASSSAKAVYCARLYGGTGLYKGWVMYSYNDVHTLYLGNDGTGWVRVNAQSIINGKSDILSMTYDGTQVDIYKNGSNPTSRITTYKINTVSGTSVGSVMGCDSGFDGFNFHGLIGEIILYDRNLSTKERQEVERYLSNKWKIRI